ncbi:MULTISPECIES: restriction endonuclease subunit S [Bacteria]|uniref:restriction endonuclease subunit S n=1 Tax=Bacteria TaxID=2 RepID=UPI00080914C4|nr:restriction endonuclease subunit S [Klebsiella pneumoniae]MBS2927796.1 restriction endonuclease subunit S [Klebsiella pneumoniae]MCM6359290.1 restriction endonuclease subunit S [Klebsiella pneumoniae]MCS5956099.1 restriction endonuclease subunit S [Klebsiella pneumoniae subsp. pneumoniae]MDH8041979.1 restriction endonuclease subunit S [Klebsiella pneumoniae]MDH8403646.1 restriction endonuclease subunit S [Klebsiella pneumoniae]
MGSNYIEMRLEDCMDAIIDYRGKTPKKVDNGIPLITAKIIKNGRIQEVSEFIAIDDYDNWMVRGLPLEGDVVLTTEAPLGEVAQLDARKVALAQRVITLRGKKGILENDYLLYLLQSSFVQNQLDGRASGSTVTGIKQSELREIILKLPPTTLQKSISHQLKCLDKKIDLNNKINQTLEQMSQTLFKSWFVDFDPVIDNALDAGNPIPETLQSRAELRQKVRNSENFKPLPADIRVLFPAEFEETELGYAPKGWMTNRLENILELAYGKALKKTERTNGNYPVYGSGGVDGTHNEYLVKGPGVIVGRKGTVGSLHWENKNFYPIDTVFFVKPKEYYSLVYCYQLLKTLGLENMNTDAAVPGLNRNNAYRLEVVTPTQSIIAKFTNIIQTIQHKMDSNHNETENLTALRDTLLPKLISGELSLENQPDLVTQTEPA